MKKGIKKFTAMLLSLTIGLSITCTNIPVYAQETRATGLPDITQFATVDELKSFNTNDNDGAKNPAKVYIGDNSQQWWIAGSQQEHGLTLFAASPLATGLKFELDVWNDKQYSDDWNCDYVSIGGSNPTEVYPNHYGASPLRNTLHGLETSYFTGAEQGLMKETTIYTNDTKNSSVYSTTDKLYLAYGDYNDNQYITVGTNSQASLNNVLRIDMDYWGNSNFWLRAPDLSPSSDALVAISGYCVRDSSVNYAYVLVPAFELNLSSVIFASAAPAASTSNLTLQDTDGAGAFTLRYKADNLGSAEVSYDKRKVTLTAVPSGTYLVVQNSAGAKEKQITAETEVSATDMGLDSFANCKVWLETTDTTNRMTYATLAEEEKETVVNITASAGLNITSKNGVQEVAPNTAITDITVEVADGYYLPDGYKDTIQGLNGLTVTETDTGFTISGTPTSDVNITLPAATVLPKSDTPVVKLKTTSTSIAATVTNHKTEFGDIEYKWNDGNWGKDKNVLSNLQPDTTYKLAVRFTGNGSYQPSDEYSVDVTTLKDGNTVLVVPTDLTVTYKEGLKLSDVDLSNTGWTWVDGNTALSAGTKSYPATFDTMSLESTTDFSGVDGYDPNTHKVTRNVEAEVKKADSAVTITTPSLDKAYDGNTVTAPEYTTSGSDGKVTITWQENTGSVDTSKWEDLKSAPSTVGIYRVIVKLAGNDNYNSASATLDFVIAKADNAWTEELSITGWTYNEKANVPSAKAQYGDVTFTYSSEENGTYTKELPKKAGTWYVKAAVAGTEIYTGLESAPVAFEIAKAIPSYEIVTGLVLGQGQPLSKIKLPEQFKWVDDTLTANELGTHTFKAVYTPEDTANYQTIEIEIEVKVVPTPVAINYVPTIIAKDQSITVSDKFNPLKDVTATDKEDGNITLTNNHIIKNTVNASKVGTYEVTYKVTDSDGATTTKTIKVKVLEATKEKETLGNVINDRTSSVDKKDYTKDSYDAYLNALEKAQTVLKNPNASKEDINKALADLEAAYKALKKADISIPDTDTPKTGDKSHLGIFACLLAVSASGIAIIAMLKKKRSIEK